MELRRFVVRGRSIVDSTGVKRRPGEGAMLDEAMANHYNKLGCIIVPVGGYSEQSVTKSAADNAGASTDVGDEAGEDAQADAGESENETPARLAPISGRRRTPR